MTTSRVILCLFALLIATYAFPSAEQVMEEDQVDDEVETINKDTPNSSSLGLTSSGFTCTSTSNKGTVYILNPQKNFAYCSVSDSTIAKATLSLNQDNSICKWTLYECIGNDAAQTKFSLFGHATQGNNGLEKHLLSLDSATSQLQITNQASDVGQFYRSVLVFGSNGGVQLVNAKSGLYVSEDGLTLTHGGAPASFKICPVGGVSTC